MKTVFRAAVFAAAMYVTAAAQNCPPTADTIVQQVLKRPQDAFASGFMITRTRALGDCAASALMRNLRLSDLNDPDIAQVVVKALGYAFLSPPPTAVIDPTKQPHAALFLLDIVAEHASDATARSNARDLLRRLESVQPPQ